MLSSSELAYILININIYDKINHNYIYLFAGHRCSNDSDHLFRISGVFYGVTS